MIRGIMYVAIVSLLISGCVTPTPGVTPTPTPTEMPSGLSVEVLASPSSAEAGKSFEVSWRVNSPVEKSITHTAVHYGQEAKSEPLTLQSYPSLTAPQGGKIPASFSASITINATGVTYFRAHAIIDGMHYWSGEKMITISAPAVPAAAPSIKVLSYPATVDGEASFTVRWEVAGGAPGDISHTAVHWGFNTGRANISDYPRLTPVQTGKTPQEFSAGIKAPASGTIYLRAHAIVDGAHVYAPEFQITINPRYTGGGGGY